MNFFEVIVAGFVLGLAGSLHCVGMCGPIIMANPYQSDSWLKRIGSSFLYFIGKAGTYAILGFSLGLIGISMIPKHWQQAVSIGTGVFMLIMTWLPRFVKSSNTNWLQQFVVKSMSKWLKSDSSYSQLMLGTLNGLLPCGLVYMALAASLTTGGIIESSLFMFVFGIGTMPLLFGIGLSKQALSFRFRHQLAQFVPVLTTILALLFILRGLSLGIPFLSPDLSKMDKMSQTMQTTTSSEPMCH